MTRERIVFRGGRVFDPTRGVFEARDVVVEEGRVVASASAAGARVVGVDGWVLPGLIDAHMHLQWLGASLRIVDLSRARSQSEAVALVAERAARAPAGAWIEGQGWDETRWQVAELPTRDELDARVPNHPVALKRVDHHALWVNGAALARAGVTRETPEVEGGRITRRGDGEPTGVLADNAAELVARHIPPLDDAAIRADIEAGLARMASHGLTCVHDMMVTPAMLRALEAIDAAGGLQVRVRAYLFGEWGEIAPLLARQPGDRLRVAGVKFFSDGTLGSRTAALEATYADAETRGLLVHAPEVLVQQVEQVQRAGYPVAIHAIGDRANRLALEAIGGAARHPASRVEHAQVLSPELLGIFERTGVTASMQPVHWADDSSWVEQRLGRARLEHAYAWKSLLDRNVPLAFGSDAPISTEDPWRGVRAVLERDDPRQRLDVATALRAYTEGAALATRDHDLGHLRPGAWADMTIVDSDPLRVRDVPPTLAMRVLAGVVTAR